MIIIYNNTSLSKMRKDLEQCLEECISNGMAILLGGDLNARIGPLGAIKEDEERASRDPKVDREGEEWMQLLNTYGLTLLNGNIDGDLTGQITRTGYAGQEDAVLDYVGVSSHKLPEIASFSIGDQGTSDHFPLEITSTVGIHCRAPEAKIQQFWNERNKKSFTEATGKPECCGWPEIYKKLWEATPKRRTVQTSEAKWWNTDCYNARKHMWEMLKEARHNDRDMNEYKEAKRRYKNTIKKAKENHLQTLKGELERVKNLSDGRKFLDKYSAKRQPKCNSKPSTGELIEHFQALLQGTEESTSPLSTPNITITLEEVSAAIQSLKQRKAAGPDDLQAEAIIFAAPECHEEIRRTIEGACNGLSIPESWGEARIWPILKKGDPRVASNYRGIAIVNAIYKLVATILNTKLNTFVEENEVIPDTQNGFRSGRSTVDNLYILDKCVKNKLRSTGGKLYTCFIDFKSAFDTVNRNILFETLQRLQIPRELIDSIRTLYGKTTYIIDTEKFSSHRGLKQGCPLSPILFALYIAELEQKLRDNQLGGTVLGQTKIYSLAFADDIVLMAERADDLKDMLRALQRFAGAKKLQINTQKTKIMTFSKGARSSGIRWSVNGISYEEVPEFKYLGVTLQRNGGFSRHHEEVALRANRRTTEVWSLGERLFKNSYKIREELFNTLVLPIILYGTEVTGFHETDVYEKIQRRYTKWVLGLPKGTRTAVLEVETSAISISAKRLERALKFENNIPQRRSSLLKAAHQAYMNWGNDDDDRGKVFRKLGWSLQEARERMHNSNGFWQAVAQRKIDQERQLSLELADKLEW